MAAVRKRVMVDKNGKRAKVVLSLKRYQRLLEDLHDLAVIAERKSEKPIGFAELKRRLKRDGLL